MVVALSRNLQQTYQTVLTLSPAENRARIKWRTHPLLKFDTVGRWLNEKADCKDEYKYRCLTALEHYCEFRELTPKQIIAECTRASRLAPPANLKPKDMLRQWQASVTGNGAERLFWGANLIRRVLPFFEANGYTLKVNPHLPKSPARETTFRLNQQVSRRMIYAAETTEHKWAFICMAESGMRPTSVCELRYRHIAEGIEGKMNPMPIYIPGRITKTGQSYVAFVLEDAVKILRRILPKHPDPDRKLVHFAADRLIHHVSDIGVVIGVNPPIGLKPLTSGSFREYVQNRFESVGITHNRVSLLMGARPTGRDAFYTNPPPEELALEYMKAADQLRIYAPPIDSQAKNH